jgi:hypothetical protein
LSFPYLVVICCVLLLSVAKARASEFWGRSVNMTTVVGVFNSFTDAKRAAAILSSLGIPERHLCIVAPGTSEARFEATLPAIEAEQPGMGRALGATVGGAIGVATGATVGAVAATILVPGVGPVVAFGLIAAALFGGGAATAGALAGEALEEGLAKGLPHDELYIYEDALRRGRTVVIALADSDPLAEQCRGELSRAGAESVDAAREAWWIGLRDAEQEHYANQGGDFKIDEAVYRLGFEAALRPGRCDRPYEQAAANIDAEYRNDSTAAAFRHGYERGLRYSRYIRYLKESERA